MNLNDHIDKIFLTVIFCAMTVVICYGHIDHDTAEWFKEGGSGVLGALLALITGPLYKKKDSTQ